MKSIYKASPTIRYLEWSREWIKYLQCPRLRILEASWLAQTFLSGVFLVKAPEKYVLEAQNNNHLMPFFFYILDFPVLWNLLALCIEKVHRLYRVSEDRSERLTWRNGNVTAMRQDDSIYLHHAIDAS